MKSQIPQGADFIRRVRQAYADGKPTKQICAENALSTRRMYRYIDGGRETEALGLAPLPRRLTGVVMARGPNGAVKRRRRHHFKGGRVALVKRIWRTAAAQVHDIETRILDATQKPDERERDARALAIMVKTLRELTLLDARRHPGKAELTPADDKDPADIDEFRNELARRIYAFVEQQSGPEIPRDPTDRHE